MDFEIYEYEAAETAIYPNRSNNLAYPALGLVGEAGEVAEKVKKIIRDHDGSAKFSQRQEIAKELGDVLWYIAALCHEIQIPMANVAKMNLKKLQSRQERNVLSGSGDNR